MPLIYEISKGTDLVIEIRGNNSEEGLTKYIKNLISSVFDYVDVNPVIQVTEMQGGNLKVVEVRCPLITRKQMYEIYKNIIKQDKNAKFSYEVKPTIEAELHKVS